MKLQFGLAVLLVAVLLLVLGITVVNATKKPDGLITPKIPKISEPHAKIDPHLLDEMKEKREVQVIIMLKDQPSKPFSVSKAKQLASRTQANLMRELSSIGAKGVKSHWIINAISATVPSNSVIRLAQRADVESIWLDQNVTLPKPPEKSNITALYPQYFTQPDYGDYAINATDMWNLGYKGDGIKIAILDTGIDRTHPMLDDLDDNPATNDPKVIAEACFTFENKVTDGNGHGTHVAGIAAGTPQKVPVFNGSYAWYSNAGNNLDSILEYTFDLTGVSSATLNFSTWYFTEPWCDCYVEVSTDGVTWDVLDVYNGYSGSNSMVNMSYNLTPYAGNTVIVRFEYVTDFSVVYPGWYVDDISVPEIGFYDDVESGGFASSVSGWSVVEQPVISGVAPKALLMNGKVLTDEGWGLTSWIIGGIEWAVYNHADIISMSLGGWQGDGSGKDPLSMAVENARNAGKVVVVAAGNAGSGEATISSPAVSKGAIAVAASDRYDAVTWWSSRGPAGDGRVGVDVAAPGDGIISAVPTGGAWYSNPSGYAVMSGTSMACPHVAGAAALLLQAFPGISPDLIERALKNSAKQIPALDFGSNIPVLADGAGRINVTAAYEALKGGILVDDEWFVGKVDSGTYSKMFTVRNNGNTDVILTISCSDLYTTWGADEGSWMSASTSSITVPAGGVATFSVTMTIPAYANGTYVGWINVGDITIPVSVSVVRDVAPNTVGVLQGVVDEDLGYEAVYYTLNVGVGVTSMNITLNASDPDSGMDIILFNPNGTVVGWGEWFSGSYTSWFGIPVDNPEQGNWTVCVVAWWLYGPTTYNLTIDATGSDVLEIMSFTASPTAVNRTDILTFTMDISNKMPYDIYAYAYISIYQLTVNGREYADYTSAEGWLAPGTNTLTATWNPDRTPGNYVAELQLYYFDGIQNVRATEATTAFTILPSSHVVVMDANGTTKSAFAPGEDIYIAATNLSPYTGYKVYIQPDPVIEGQLLDPARDPSTTQEVVFTDANGSVQPTLVWSIPPDATPTYAKYDIILDKQGVAGTGSYNGDDDGINSIVTYGIVAPIPEVATMLLVSAGVVALSRLKRKM